ncbi:MAG: GAF domain-containing sensor histidine kinase [Gemmatimonadota bacterium]|nr:GAF domain-containing sensor histidine kinase [Gemmatimonadota bacterium]MDH5283348.1 GAF domain-containing sensor histidine kinase [Gemmatimonadota bacterium]
MAPARSENPTTAARLERLVEGSSRLIGEYSLAGVLQGVADLAAELIGARFAAVGILASDGRTLESFTTAGITHAERERIGRPPTGGGVLGLVIREARPIRLADIWAHPASKGFPPNHPEMRSFLGVPILGRRTALGNLYLAEKIGAAEFTEEDEHLATLLAAKAAAAIENARLHEESARLLEEVQRLHRSRERFFAMVNHELRNALAGVYGWAEMLVRRKDPATVPRAAFEVLDSADLAISLINDLLDLSRLDEDRLRPVIREVDCGSMVRNAVSRVTPAAESKQVRLESQVPEPGPTCRTDPSRVEQILVNLLTNAIRHTPAGSAVLLAVTAPGEAEMVLFQIDDQGEGIAASDVEKIFDIYQTKAGEEGKGSGLGLPLSRRLARLLGGELYAVAAEGFGGRFILHLPTGNK